jgi:hypothetical protein
VKRSLGSEYLCSPEAGKSAPDESRSAFVGPYDAHGVLAGSRVWDSSTVLRPRARHLGQCFIASHVAFGVMLSPHLGQSRRSCSRGRARLRVL